MFEEWCKKKLMDNFLLYKICKENNIYKIHKVLPNMYRKELH